MGAGVGEEIIPLKLSDFGGRYLKVATGFAGGVSSIPRPESDLLRLMRFSLTADKSPFKFLEAFVFKGEKSSSELSMLTSLFHLTA